MNLENVTVEDAVENYYRKGMAIILNSGEVKGFEKDNERNFCDERSVPGAGRSGEQGNT